jgi:uncharacterized protein DUF4124
VNRRHGDRYTAIAMLRSLMLTALAVAVCGSAGAQIRRCEAPNGDITYSNEDCPRGTRAVKSLPPATQPTPAERKAAQERAKRQSAVGQSIGQSRSVQSAAAAQGYITVEEARRAADCAYLQAELDASRRLRNVLTTRPYYSADDVEQMDARTAQLASEYRRVCTR